jgi:hypothetical protein
MQYLNYAPQTAVYFTPKKGTTVAQALNEAIEFVKAHHIKNCELYYNGFCFGIEANSNINELVSDYVNWIKMGFSF